MCALSGAMETVWVALAQLRAQMQMMRACVCAPYDVPLSSARIAIRQPLMRRVRRVIARSVFRLVLGSTVESDTHLRRFGYPKLHIFHVV